MNRLKTCFSFLLPAVLLGSALAQQPPSQVGDPTAITGKVRRLGRAPVSNELLKVKLPKAKEFTLANGLTVMVLEQRKLPTVSYSLWIKSGALSDPQNMPGLASFTADMLREGTAKRTSAQISSELDDLGASLGANAEFGRELTIIGGSGLSESADKLMEIVADVAMNATFPSEELERYRRRQMQALTGLRTNPSFLARERFLNAVYGAGPLAVQAPTPESLRGVKSEDLKAFRDKYYAPNNAILGLAGDITLAQAKALAEKHFGSWKKSDLPKSNVPQVTSRNNAKVYMVDRPASVQSNIVVGTVSLKRNDPDYVPVLVLNRVLGGASSARLFQNLREDKGYTYGAYSSVSSDIYPGQLSASTQVRNAVTDGSLKEIMYELKRIRDEKVGTEELEDAKRALVAGFALSLESPSGLLDRSMTLKYYGLPADYWDTYPDQVAKVNADTVQKMAQKYIDLPHMQIVVVGDAKQVGEAVSKYGTVETFDAEGKPVTKP